MNKDIRLKRLLTQCQALLSSPLGAGGRESGNEPAVEAQARPREVESRSGESESDVQLLARGMSLQKSVRGRFTKKPSLKSSLKLRMTAMRLTRIRTYKRDGPPKEVDVPPTATYFEVAVLGAKALGIHENITFDGQWGLFRLDGTVIPEEPGWTIEEYLSQFQKTPSQFKLGVGVLYETHSDVQPPKKKKRAMTGFTGSSRDDTISSNADDDEVEVLYVPFLGPTGFDLTLPLKREQVYHIRVKKDCPPTLDFHPEVVSYCVFSIITGDKCILSIDASGMYSVLNDQQDKCFVLHQSPRHVKRLDKEIIPLFCVVAGHSTKVQYRWQSGSQDVGTNSPVLWVHLPGTYKCTITNGLRSCTSTLISVEDSFVIDSAMSSPNPVLSPFDLSPSPIDQSFVDGSAMTFNKNDLENATDNFDDKNIIGKGGFGVVYHGIFRSADIAVKVLSKHGVQLLVSDDETRIDREQQRAQWESLLATEVATLTRFRHPNLVGFMGHCSDPPALVYPFMEKGSLYDNLHKYKITKGLSMENRVSILADVASGLAYLHGETPPVIHHDINSMNILLDSHLCGKLSDFGFSIQLPKSHANKTLITATTGLPGTNGYRPPEYSDSKYSVLSDIYSFGVVLLECYTGQLAFSNDREANNLIDSTEDERMDLSAFMRLVDPKAGPVTEDMTSQILSIINLSVKRIPSRRPPISTVIKNLKDILK